MLLPTSLINLMSPVPAALHAAFCPGFTCGIPWRCCSKVAAHTCLLPSHLAKQLCIHAQAAPAPMHGDAVSDDSWGCHHDAFTCRGHASKCTAPCSSTGVAGLLSARLQQPQGCTVLARVPVSCDTATLQSATSRLLRAPAWACLMQGHVFSKSASFPCPGPAAPHLVRPILQIPVGGMCTPTTVAASSTAMKLASIHQFTAHNMPRHLYTNPHTAQHRT